MVFLYHKVSQRSEATNEHSGSNISMQIIGDNYYVYCVRKKSYITYKWKEKHE